MVKVSEEKIVADYTKYKTKLKNEIKNNNIEKALIYGKYLSSLARRFCIIPNFIDTELEEQLDKISSLIFDNIQFKKTVEKNECIVYYSTNTVDNGALTEQYLNFLNDKHYNYIYITIDKLSHKRGKRILDKAKDKQIIIEEGIEAIKKIANIVIRQKPSKIWLHLTPDDVIGYCAFSLFKTYPGIYIVHNSHSFWIGKSLVTHFVEFQEAGVYVSHVKRGIPLEKIYLCPFYPIDRKDHKITKQPFFREKRYKCLIAGNVYKILNSNKISTINAVKYLLKELPNIEFNFATIGDYGLIKCKFNSNELKKIKFLGYQSDFDELITDFDFLLDTFPFGGGLIRQYAIRSDIPIFRITEDQLRGIMGTKEIYNLPQDFDCENLADLKKKISTFINKENDIFFIKRIQQMKNNISNREVFQKKLSEQILTEKHYNGDQYLKFRWNRSSLLDLYIDYENSFSNKYYIDKYQILGKYNDIYSIIIAILIQYPIMILRKILNLTKIFK